MIPERQNVSDDALVLSARQRFRHQCYVVSRIIRTHPGTLAIPVFLFAVLCGLSIFGVIEADKSAKRSSKDTAADLGGDLANELVQYIRNGLIQAKTLAAMVEVHPDGAIYSTAWGFLSARILNLTVDVVPLCPVLELLPFGVLTLSTGKGVVLGTSIFHGTWGAEAVAQVASGATELYGPMPRSAAVSTQPGAAELGTAAHPTAASEVQGPSPGDFGAYQGLVIEARLPVHVRNASASATWNWPAASMPECSSTPGCWVPTQNETIGVKFWGFVQVQIGLHQSVLTQLRKLASIRHQGFHARILYRPTAALASALGEAVQSGSTDSSGSTRPALRVLTSTWEGGWEVAGAQDSVAVTFDMGLGGALYADEWLVELVKEGGWNASWRDGLLAFVVVMSAIIGVLVFAVLLYGQQHRMLLYSLMPRTVVHRLTRGDEFLKLQSQAGLVETGTPAERMLELLGEMLEGRPVALSDVLYVRSALLQSANIYQPLDIQQQLADLNIEDDVAFALMRELQGLRSPGAGAGAGAATWGNFLAATNSIKGGAFNHPRRNSAMSSVTGGGGPLAATAMAPGQDTAHEGVFEELTSALAALASDAVGPAAGAAATSGPHHSSGHTGTTGPVYAALKVFAGEYGSAVLGSDNTPTCSRRSPLQQHASVASGLGDMGDGSLLLHARSHSSVTSGAHLTGSAHPTNCPPTPRNHTVGGFAQGGERERERGEKAGSSVLSSLFERGEKEKERESAPLPERLMRLVTGGDRSLTGGSRGGSVTGGGVGSPGGSAGAPHVRPSLLARGGVCASPVMNLSLGPTTSSGGIAVTSDRSETGGSLLPRCSLLTVQSVTSKNQAGSSIGLRTGGPLLAPPALLLSSPTQPPSQLSPTHLGPQSPSHTSRAHTSGRDSRTTGGMGGGGFREEEASIPGHSSVHVTPASAHSSMCLANHGTGAGDVAATGQVGVEGEGGQGRESAPPVTQVPAPMVEELERFLATHTDNWTFDAFALDELAAGHSLSTLGFYLLHTSGLMSRFNMRGAQAARFLRAVEAGYRDNPYHNRTHAADVLQTMHALLTRGGLVPHYADPLTQLACYLAAATHDLEHVGLTNDFLIASNHELAIVYNDKSPMENHHLASAFALLKQPDLAITSNMSRAEREKLRKTMIELVLATDMKQHLAICAQFSTMHRLGAYLPGAAEAALAAASPVSAPSHGGVAAGSGGNPGPGPTRVVSGGAGPPPSSGPSGAGGGTLSGGSTMSLAPRLSGRLSHSAGLQPPDAHTPEAPSNRSPQHSAGTTSGTAVPPVSPVPLEEGERVLSLSVALKCADIGLLGEQLDTNLRWVGCLEEEFFNQGDREKAAGLTVSPLMDRDRPGVSKSQVGFYDFVALPMFYNFTRVFPAARPLLELAMSNYRYWVAKFPPAPPAPPATPADPSQTPHSAPSTTPSAPRHHSHGGASGDSMTTGPPAASASASVSARPFSAASLASLGASHKGGGGGAGGSESSKAGGLGASARLRLTNPKKGQGSGPSASLGRHPSAGAGLGAGSNVSAHGEAAAAAGAGAEGARVGQSQEADTRRSASLGRARHTAD